MIKVLIADDELLVRVGLKTTIDWEKNGFTIVGEAASGKEAVELFDQCDPDILITDIRMPIMDGLELIQTLQQKKPALKSIILTHYDDFNYAHKAIKLGASEYILKHNLSSDELLKILNRLSEEIRSKQAIKEFGTAGGQAVSSGLSMEHVLEMAYLSALGKQDFSKLLDLDSIHFRFDHFFVAFGRFIYNSEKDDEFIERNLVKNMIRSVISKEQGDCTEIYTTEHLILLYNVKTSPDESQASFEIVTTLKKNMHQYFDIDMVVGISDVSTDISTIPALIGQARTASERYYFDSSSTVFLKSELPPIAEGYASVDFNTIKKHMANNDETKLHGYIEELFNIAFQTNNKEIVQKLFIDLVSYARISYANTTNEPPTDVIEEKFKYGTFDKLDTFQSTVPYILDVYDFILEAKSNRKKTYSAVISKSIDYIEKNFFHNLSLEEVADYAEISKSYLSLLFKQETGINFSEYLTSYRIEQSKKLIETTNCKVYEIADQVGFDNPYYFSRVFKDRVGLSCKEYKNRHHSHA